MLLKRPFVLSVLILYVAFSVCPAQSAAEHATRSAKDIHQRILTLDAHVDIAGAEYATEKLDPGIDHPKLKCDLVKMEKGGVDGVFLVFPCGKGVRVLRKRRTNSASSIRKA